MGMQIPTCRKVMAYDLRPNEGALEETTVGAFRTATGSKVT